MHVYQCPSTVQYPGLPHTYSPLHSLLLRLTHALTVEATDNITPPPRFASIIENDNDNVFQGCMLHDYTENTLLNTTVL